MFRTLSHAPSTIVVALLTAAALSAPAQAALIDQATVTADAVNQLSVTLDTSGAGQTVLGVLNLNIPSDITPFGANSGSNRPVALGLSQPYLLTLNKNFELTLWNFVKTVGAQQTNLPMELAALNLTTLQNTLAAEVAAVPLPAAGWLFVTGLLGLVGSKLKRGAKPREALAGNVVHA